MALPNSKSISRCQQDAALTFTRNLFSKQDNQDKNLVFSPFSLHAALCVMAAGSDSCTLDQLLDYLGTDSVDNLTTFFSQLVSTMISSDDAAPSPRLSFANGMWVDKSLLLAHSFKQHVATHYKATLNSANFQERADQVCNEVNLWVDKETHGLIKNLLPARKVNYSTSLIFANALHFKGEWEHKFSPACTCNRDFHLLNGTSVKVPFMTSKEDQSIRVFDGFKVLRLSYKQCTDKSRQFSMYILLPDAKDGLSALIEKMGSESGFLEGKLPEGIVKVQYLMIPKFNFSFNFDASDLLSKLGLVSPFSPFGLDFTKMVVNPVDGLYVESVFHKASIEVNEEGTESGAASLSVGMPLGFNSGMNFKADHPFLFLIREDFTGTILFVGQVLNPNGVPNPVKPNRTGGCYEVSYPSYRDFECLLPKRKMPSEDDSGEDGGGEDDSDEDDGGEDDSDEDDGGEDDSDEDDGGEDDSNEDDWGENDL